MYRVNCSLPFHPPDYGSIISKCLWNWDFNNANTYSVSEPLDCQVYYLCSRFNPSYIDTSVTMKCQDSNRYWSDSKQACVTSGEMTPSELQECGLRAWSASVLGSIDWRHHQVIQYITIFTHLCFVFKIIKILVNMYLDERLCCFSIHKSFQTWIVRYLTCCRKYKLAINNMLKHQISHQQHVNAQNWSSTTCWNTKSAINNSGNYGFTPISFNFQKKPAKCEVSK